MKGNDTLLDVLCLFQFLLYQETGDQKWLGPFSDYMYKWINCNDPSCTSKGLAWRLTWGSLRYAANTAFLGLVAHKHGVLNGDEAVYQFSKTQIDYMLGSSGRSFVVGFGENPPQRPHHAAA